MLNRTLISTSWTWVLSSTPEQLWPYVTDLNRMLRDIGQPAVRRSDRTTDTTPDHIEPPCDNMNRNNEPTEWEYPYRFEITHYYRSGPYLNLYLGVDLYPLDSGTKIKIRIKGNRKNNLFSLFSELKLKTVIKRRIKKTLRFCDELAYTGKPAYRYNRPKRFARSSINRLREIETALGDYPVDMELYDKLVNFIRRADDAALKRISPVRMARIWKKPVGEVLKFFLCAAKAGLLKFFWDMYCSRCRKVQATHETLSEVFEPVYCHHCRKEFTVNFNRSVRIGFTAHPSIRKISPDTCSIEEPPAMSHIMVQQYLKPGERKYLKTCLPEGRFVLKADNQSGEAIVSVHEKGKNTVYIGVNGTGLDGESVQVNREPNLMFENRSQMPQIITLEKAEWEKSELTGAGITSLQLFRDLFSREVLRQGERLAVDEITLMFTDLLDSTSMFNEEGDEKAAGRVIDHLEILQKAVAEENGAIVKTIGDSVMAVFTRPEQAVRAYLNAHQRILLDSRFDKLLKLKAGIHHGSCVAVNLNNRIDYYGSTVNIASRLVDFAGQNELIVSDEAFKELSLNKILQDYDSDYLVENHTTCLKGFDDESFRIKNIRLDRPDLRVAI